MPTINLLIERAAAQAVLLAHLGESSLTDEIIYDDEGLVCITIWICNLVKLVVNTLEICISCILHCKFMLSRDCCNFRGSFSAMVSCLDCLCSQSHLKHVQRKVSWCTAFTEAYDCNSI